MFNRRLKAFLALCFSIFILSGCGGSSSGSGDNTPPPGTGLNVELVSDVLRIGEGTKITATYYSGDSSRDVTDLTLCLPANGKTYVFNNYLVAQEAGDESLECTYNFESQTERVTVQDIAPESTELIADDRTLHIGAAYDYSYVGLYPDGSQIDYSRYSSWFSSDEAVASSDYGTIQGISFGTATIRASNVATGLLFQETSIEVIPGVPDRIEVSQDQPFYIGVTRQFTATGFWDDGDEAVLNGATWSSSNDRAELSGSPQSGSFTAVEEGAVSITAELQGTSDTLDTEVTAAIVVSVRTAPPSKERLTSGETIAVRAYATFSDGAELDISGTADWRSSKGEVEFTTVSPTNEAFMTATNESNTLTRFWADYDGVNGGATGSQIIYLDIPN